MNKDELKNEIERARTEHLQNLLAYRKWYVQEGLRSEDGFEILHGLPEGVEWKLEEDAVYMTGNMEGLQEMTMIIQAFTHDEECTGLFYQQFLLVKHHEPMPYEDLIVIAMPEEVWAFWGGKMADVAWGNDFDELTFNSMGFFEETLPIDLGIRLIQ